MLDATGWPAIAASLSLIALSLVVARALGLRVERDIVVASVRAALQLLAVGIAFVFIFESSAAVVWAWCWVVFMVALGSAVVLRRASSLVGGLAAAVVGAVAGSTAIALAVVFGFGVIDYEPVALVVVAGITIGNAVPVTVLGANQAMTLCRDRRGEIEAALALGFDRAGAVRFFAPEAARTSLIPQIERTKVVGLIALPGAMTGLLLAGVDPLDAVVVQLLVMYLVLGSAALCVITVVTVVLRSAIAEDCRTAPWVSHEGP